MTWTCEGRGRPASDLDSALRAGVACLLACALLGGCDAGAALEGDALGGDVGAELGPALERHVSHLQGAAVVCAKPLPNGQCPCVTTQDCAANVTDPCRTLTCVQGVCDYPQDPARLDCCSTWTNPGCDDKNLCTIDSCSVTKTGWTQCAHGKDPSKPTCCDPYAQGNTCHDGDPCTADFCNNWTCLHYVVPACCSAEKPCDDGDVCTTESCVKVDAQDPAGICKVVSTKAGCCTWAGDCDDGKACTVDACDPGTHACTHAPSANPLCCEGAEDCDDGDACTADVCVNQGCHYLATAACCASAADCDDGDVCTVDTCVGGTCSHGAGASQCCGSDADCDSGSAFMTASCVLGGCVVAPKPGQAGRCTVATAAADCWPYAAPGGGPLSCELQPDGLWWCAD